MNAVQNDAVFAQDILQLPNLILKLAGCDALFHAERSGRAGGLAGDHGLLQESLVRPAVGDVVRAAIGRFALSLERQGAAVDRVLGAGGEGIKCLAQNVVS